MFQFLTASDEENQQRLDNIYDQIATILELSLSQNPKLQQFLSSYTASHEIHKWWAQLHEYFLPSTELAKQQRELKFAEISQGSTENNREFIQRVKLECEILKYVGQEISESRFRLCISKGLLEPVKKKRLQLMTKKILQHGLSMCRNWKRFMTQNHMLPTYQL